MLHSRDPLSSRMPSDIQGALADEQISHSARLNLDRDYLPVSVTSSGVIVGDIAIPHCMAAKRTKLFPLERDLARSDRSSGCFRGAAIIGEA